MNVNAGNASSLSFVSCMHSTSGCMSAIHCSTRSRRAFSELTFQVAIRTVATVANCQRRAYADLARRRVALTGSGAWGGAMTATACFEARFLAGVAGAASGTAADAGFAVAAFFARVLVAAGIAGSTADGFAGWTAGCLAGSFIARFFGAASTTAAAAGSTGGGTGVAVAVAAAFLFRFGGASRGASTGAPLTVVIVGIARSTLRRAGAKLSTTRVTDSPIFMNSRALRGGGSDMRLSGTYPFTSPIRTYAPCDE